MELTIKSEFDIGDKVYVVDCTYSEFRCGTLPVYKADKRPMKIKSIRTKVSTDTVTHEYGVEAGLFLCGWYGSSRVYPTWEKAYERVCYLNRGLPNE